MKRSSTVLIAALGIGAAALAIALLPKKSSGADGGGGDGGLPGPSSTGGLDQVRQIAKAIGAPPQWQDFFVLVAAGESKGHGDYGRGSTLNAPPWATIIEDSGEAEAAARAYDRNKAMFTGCWPAAAYAFGSGGYYAMLPANALAAFESTPLMCLHPWTVFDATIATIMAAWFARRLTGWSNWQGTVLSLRRGWGNPSAMDSPEDRRGEYEEDCRRAGLPTSFLDVKLERWKPAPADELFERLGGNRGWLPGGRS